VEPIAAAFGTALVAAMATDSWQQACQAVAALWQRLRSPRHARAIEGQLEELRGLLLADGRAGAEQSLAREWRDRCLALMRDNPDAAAELRQAVDEVLTPMLAPAGPARVGQVIMTGSSYGAGTFNQVAGDQYNIRL
jgi:hypothetical protein